MIIVISLYKHVSDGSSKNAQPFTSQTLSKSIAADKLILKIPDGSISEIDIQPKSY
jgi:hypothetical protein